MKIIVINGPNLNLLGQRETSIYGTLTYSLLCDKIIEESKNLNLSTEIFQYNSEGDIVSKIHDCIGNFDFIIGNFGAYTHTSIAIRDAILAVNIPFIEVHISNIFKREDFRHNSFFSDIAVGCISGFGVNSYLLALRAAREYFK